MRQKSFNEPQSIFIYIHITLLTISQSLFSGALAGNSRKFRQEFLTDFPTPGTGPYFDTSIVTNVTGLVGKTVHLVCKVKNLGNKTVSVKANKKKNRVKNYGWNVSKVAHHENFRSTKAQ